MLDNLKKILKNNFKWIVLIIFLVVFYEIVENIFQNEIGLLDSVIYNTISKFISEGVTKVFRVITEFGGAFVVIGICILSFILLKNKNYGKYISLNLIIIFLLNQMMKNIFQRHRPAEFRIINESGYSFPSGHSMVSMAFYGFIIYLIYKNVENKKIKWTLCTFLTLLIFLVGISRIYLGVHYASDVIGGFCFSLAYLILYINIVSKKLNEIEGEING